MVQPLFSSVRTALSATGGSLLCFIACVGEVREDEKLTGEILPVIKGLEAAKIVGQRADGIEILPFFHYADLRAQPHGRHAELGKLLGREVDGENDRRHACTSPGVWRRKPAHMRSPASDQK